MPGILEFRHSYQWFRITNASLLNDVHIDEFIDEKRIQNKYGFRRSSDKQKRLFEYIDNNPSVSHEITTTNKGSQTTKEIYKKNPYTIDGLCVFLKLTTLKHYRKRSEFLPVFNYIDKVIYNQKFSGATRGDFSATIIARDLGLVDKTDNKNENTNTNTEMTPEERDRRIKELEKKMKRR